MNLHQRIGKFALGPFSKALPPIGETERAALEAGTVGFEGKLFAGRPDFDALLDVGPNRLRDDEAAFLANEVAQLCAMLDEHAIDEARDLPIEVWQFLRDKRFFGMIIPKEHGGLGFSHFAHATVVTRISTISAAAAVTVMVPNSLGPAELLLQYGTDAQKSHYLPRLADGRDLPCLVSPRRMPARTLHRSPTVACSPNARSTARLCAAFWLTSTSATSRSRQSRPSSAWPSRRSIPLARTTTPMTMASSASLAH